MSDLQTRGIPYTIGGKERHLLFTLAVVDEIQAKYDKAVSEVLFDMKDPAKTYDILAFVVMTLINDEVRRNNYFGNASDPEVSEQELKWLIDVPMSTELVKVVFKAFGFSIPDNEDDDPNLTKSRSS